jgi:hypothetical protein
MSYRLGSPALTAKSGTFSTPNKCVALAGRVKSIDVRVGKDFFCLGLGKNAKGAPQILDHVESSFRWLGD